MSNTYMKRTCRCGKEVSSNGAAWHNHIMMHVRKGEATLKECGFFRSARQIQKVYREVVWVKEPQKN